MSVLDCITSFVDGRVRLRHPALKDAATAELIRSVVSGVDGITAVQANPVTGSLLIFYDPEKFSREQLLELAEQGMAFLPEAFSAQESGEALDGNAEGAAARAMKAVKELAPVDEALQLLCGRGATKFVNRAMLVTLAASLAGLPLGNRLLHTAAGGAFVGSVLQHLLAHRKAI
ncbi:HMA2 domain-containing protein [Mailhella sp.]|uniref:HMA2 domain-containing protein n=1 Tax=Mailhella sp. TaxID=1981029 RepID=UPI0040639E84